MSRTEEGGHVQCGDLSAFNRWHCWDPLGNDSENSASWGFRSHHSGGAETCPGSQLSRGAMWSLLAGICYLAGTGTRKGCWKGGARRAEKGSSWVQVGRGDPRIFDTGPIPMWEWNQWMCGKDWWKDWGLVYIILYKQIKKEQLISQAFAWQPLLAAAAFRLVLTALRFAAAIMSTHLRWTLCRTPKAEMELRNSNLQ